MKTNARHIQGILALSLAVGPVSACDEGTDARMVDEADQADGGPEGKGDDLDASAHRREVMRAIHTDFIDDIVHGQPNELLVSEYRVAGNHAWVEAKVQAPGGGEVDWSRSEVAEDLDSGFFDGPYLQALVLHDGDGWQVLSAAVGATDLWWDRLWERFPISCGLFPDDGRCTPVAEPVWGTPERKAITGAIHDQFLDEFLHDQPNELVISWLQAGGGFAFLRADVQGKGGTAIDWSNTIFAEDVADGTFEGPGVEVFLMLDGGRWIAREYAMGPTDVWWWGLWDDQAYDRAPCAIFDLQECVPVY